MKEKELQEMVLALEKENQQLKAEIQLESLKEDKIYRYQKIKNSLELNTTLKKIGQVLVNKFAENETKETTREPEVSTPKVVGKDPEETDTVPGSEQPEEDEEEDESEEDEEQYEDKEEDSEDERTLKERIRDINKRLSKPKKKK